VVRQRSGWLARVPVVASCTPATARLAALLDILSDAMPMRDDQLTTLRRLI